MRRTGMVAAVSLVATVLGSGAAYAGPGDLDAGFGGSAHGRVVDGRKPTETTGRALAVQPDGGIIVVGRASHPTQGDVVRVFRLTPDGTRDKAFGVRILGGTALPGPEAAFAAASLANGRILIAGTVTSDGRDDIAVWRLKSNGEPDPSFGGDGLVSYGQPGTFDVPFELAVDAQGRVVVAGVTLDQNAGTQDWRVIRLRPDGSPDPTFSAGHTFDLVHPGVDQLRALVLQPDGKVLLGGTLATTPSNNATVVRLRPGTETAAATLDPTFDHDGYAGAPGTKDLADLALQEDGALLIATTVSLGGGNSDLAVVRMTSGGLVDASYGSATGVHVDGGSLSDTAAAVAVLPSDGAIVLGRTGVSGGRPFIAKLSRAGRLDQDLGPGGVRLLRDGDSLTDLAVQDDGRLLLTGQVSEDTYLPGRPLVLRLTGELRAPSCGGRKATIVGTKASDRLVGTGRADVIAGGAGHDTITGLGKGDVVCGGSGNDRISGGAGADRLLGQGGRDRLLGGPGRDVLVGGPGRDVVRQ